MSRRGGFQPHGELAKTICVMDELNERMRSAAARMRENTAGSAEVEDRNRRLALAEGVALQEEMKAWPVPQSSPGARPRRPISASATTTQAWQQSTRATG